MQIKVKCSFICIFFCQLLEISFEPVHHFMANLISRPFPSSVSPRSACLAVTTGRFCKVQSDNDGVTFQISMIKLPIPALLCSSPVMCTHTHTYTNKCGHVRRHTEVKTRTGISDDLLSDKSSLRDFYTCTHTCTQSSPLLRRGITGCHLAGRVSPDPGSWEYGGGVTLVVI